MSYIYVLQSPDGSDIYIGFSNNLKRRMAEHERSAHPVGGSFITKHTNRKAMRDGENVV